MEKFHTNVKNSTELFLFCGNKRQNSTDFSYSTEFLLLFPQKKTILWNFHLYFHRTKKFCGNFGHGMEFFCGKIPRDVRQYPQNKKILWNFYIFFHRITKFHRIFIILQNNATESEKYHRTHRIQNFTSYLGGVVVIFWKIQKLENCPLPIPLKFYFWNF